MINETKIGQSLVCWTTSCSNTYMFECATEVNKESQSLRVEAHMTHHLLRAAKWVFSLLSVQGSHLLLYALLYTYNFWSEVHFLQYIVPL